MEEGKSNLNNQADIHLLQQGQLLQEEPIHVNVINDPEIFMPARRGELAAVVAILKKDPLLVNAKYGGEATKKIFQSVTMLIMACKGGKQEIVSLLLDRGSDINAHDNDGINALMFAANYAKQ